MRRLIGVMTIAMGLGLGMSGVSHAQVVTTGIAGSSHDFTDNIRNRRDASSTGTGGAIAFTESWNGRGEICRVCHVPHDHGQVAKRYTNGLLWNHGVSTAQYTMYNSAWSSTLDNAQSAQPDGTAKLCLGCHDGTVGLDTFDKYAGASDSTTGLPTLTISTYDSGYKVPGFTDGGNLDLRGTHPISIAYNGADANKLRPAATATWASGDTVASTLDNGKVQCSTCHDVHAQESVLGTHLLRQGQTAATGGASRLCLTCHIK